MHPTEKVRTALHGAAVTSATPYSSDLGRVETERLRENTDFLLEQGASMFYPCGNTGEFSSLSLDDWTDVLQTVVACAEGSSAAMVVGIGQNLPTVLEMRRRADDLGADGVMIMTPEQPHISEEGLRRYLELVIEGGEAPVVLYRRPHGPDDATVSALIQHPKVVGVKYGVNDVHAFRDAVVAGGDAVVWTCGIAERYAPAFAVHGSVGFTSGLINFAPQLSLKMADALAEGDVKTAIEIRDQVAGFEALRARDADANNVAAVKVGMDHHGLTGGAVRPPLRDLDRETVLEVQSLTEGWA
jgi:4-hydroxy-tetrahydrodipicolinate synthase